MKPFQFNGRDNNRIARAEMIRQRQETTFELGGEGKTKVEACFQTTEKRQQRNNNRRCGVGVGVGKMSPKTREVINIQM